MANPQPDRYTRLSNELFEAIMQTDFSKRQRSMLDLIIRASYGCNKKYALLRPSDFEVVGVYKTHVKKELEYLCRARVIFIDGERISLNKDYDQWRINLCKPCNGDKFQEILRRNITGEVTETVTKVTKIVNIEQIDGYQNSNSEVTKTVTETPLQSPQPPELAGCLKTIKDNIINSSSNRDTDLAKVATFYSQKVCPGSLNSFQAKVLAERLDEGMEPDLMIWAMQKALYNGIPRFDYIDGILKNLQSSGILTKAEAIREEEIHKRRGVNTNENKRGSPRGSRPHQRSARAGANLESIVISGAGDETTEPG